MPMWTGSPPSQCPTRLGGAGLCLCDTHSDIMSFLKARGVGKEQFPERLIQLDELPRSSGDKVAKGNCCGDIRRRLGAE